MILSTCLFSEAHTALLSPFPVWLVGLVSYSCWRASYFNSWPGFARLWNCKWSSALKHEGGSEEASVCRRTDWIKKAWLVVEQKGDSEGLRTWVKQVEQLLCLLVVPPRPPKWVRSLLWDDAQIGDVSTPPGATLDFLCPYLGKSFFIEHRVCSQLSHRNEARPVLLSCFITKNMEI